MAYDSQGLKLISDGGAVGAAPGNVKSVYAYASNDTAAAIEAAGYFNGAKDHVKTGDLIVVSGDNDGAPFAKAYAVTGNDGTAVTVKVMAAGLAAAASLDFGSIAAAASAELTIAVAGAAVGDSVALALPAAPTAGLVFQAFVSAANTVTLRATNITAGAIDPAAASYGVTVFKA